MFGIKQKIVVGVTVLVAVCGSLGATAAAQVTVHRVAARLTPTQQQALLGGASLNDIKIGNRSQFANCTCR